MWERKRKKKIERNWKNSFSDNKSRVTNISTQLLF